MDIKINLKKDLVTYNGIKVNLKDSPTEVKITKVKTKKGKEYLVIESIFDFYIGHTHLIDLKENKYKSELEYLRTNGHIYERFPTPNMKKNKKPMTMKKIDSVIEEEEISF